jgi:hypothetical protein
MTAAVHLLVATTIQQRQARLIEHAGSSQRRRKPNMRVEPRFLGDSRNLGYGGVCKATLANLLLHESRVDLSPLARRRRTGMAYLLPTALRAMIAVVAPLTGGPLL